MKGPNFLLYGIGGVYNYGCEAIVRGTEIILREIWPDAVIRYASLRPEDDALRLKDTRVEIIPRKRYSRYSMTNICRKVVSMAGGSWTPVMDNLDFLDDFDMVLSIGGDLYTAPKNRYPRDLLKFGEVVMERGKKFIIWGASVGPFYVDNSIEKILKNHFNKVHLITSREIASTNYLESLGVQKNVVVCADPAYVVYPKIVQAYRPLGQLRIGVNLSPLSAQYAMSDKDVQKVILGHAKTIVKLVREFDASIVFIPHVICNFKEQDDDLTYMQAVMQNLPEDVVDKVELNNKDLGFLGAKSEIIKCHLVIAARMHCAINAITAGVPTILVSYSQKAVGMAEYVYGNKKWVVPVQEFSSPLFINVVKDMLSEHIFIADYLTNRVLCIKKDVKNAGIALAELVN